MHHPGQAGNRRRKGKLRPNQKLRPRPQPVTPARPAPPPSPRVLSAEERADFVVRSRELYESIWAPEGDAPGVRETRACLFHAVSLQMLLAKEAGIHTMLQAGSAMWPMMRPEEDEGVGATHFSYVWPGLDDPMTQHRLALGALPEMHAWLAMRGPDTLIDPTAGTWPARAALAGFEWTAPPPPPFLWHTLPALAALSDRDFSLGIVYRPDLEATRVADALAQRMIYPLVSAALGIPSRQG